MAEEDRVIVIEAPAAYEEWVLGALTMVGLDEVEIRLVDGTRAQVRAFWPSENGPLPEVDLSSIPDARRLPTERVLRSSWTQGWPPRRVGPFWLTPIASGQTGATPASSVTTHTIAIEAGRGFGWGEHPSTRLALTALAALPPLDGLEVVDIGCGTGILALAALRLGAHKAVAYDIEPSARAAAAANAEHNGLSLTVVESMPTVGGDLVLANITPPVLAELADALIGLIAPNGRLILSGLLDADADRLAPAFRPLKEVTRHREDDWVAVTFSF